MSTIGKNFVGQYPLYMAYVAMHMQIPVAWDHWSMFLLPRHTSPDFIQGEWVVYSLLAAQHVWQFLSVSINTTSVSIWPYPKKGHRHLLLSAALYIGLCARKWPYKRARSRSPQIFMNCAFPEHRLSLFPPGFALAIKCLQLRTHFAWFPIINAIISLFPLLFQSRNMTFIILSVHHAAQSYSCVYIFVACFSSFLLCYVLQGTAPLSAGSSLLVCVYANNFPPFSIPRIVWSSQILIMALAYSNVV